MEQTPDSEKKYWIAHVRGPFYDKLRNLGFKVFYPYMDDYVFLEIKDKNKPLLKKQMELCIYFLKKKEKLLVVSEAEVERMTQGAKEKQEESEEVEVISGYCSGLMGKILEREEKHCRCLLQGFNRTYDVLVDRLDLVYRTG